MFIDCHTHLSWFRPESLKQYLKAAKASGTEFFIENSLAADGIELDRTGEASRVIEFAESHEEVYCGLGAHPRWAEAYSDSHFKSYRRLLKSHSKKIVCLGEIGLDYNIDAKTGRATASPISPQFAEKQRQVFREMVRLGREFGLPVNMHCNRTGLRDALVILREEKAYEVGGMLHNFVYDAEEARQLFEVGCYASVGYHFIEPMEPASAKAFGANSLDDQAKAFSSMSIGQIVLETDIGSLKPNLEDWVPKNVAAKLAKLKELPIDQVESMTTLNAARLFRLPKTSPT